MGFVARLRMKADYEAERGLIQSSSPDERIIEADLFGEGEWVWQDSGSPSLEFERGVVTYPLPQQTVYLTPKQELRFIYGQSGEEGFQIGEHVGSGGAPCFANFNELLGKHTAFLGSTGAGKSGAVAAVLHSILERGEKNSYVAWHPRIVVLDPHNEYGAAFSCYYTIVDRRRISQSPYWLLSFQETLSLLVGKTEFVATSQANIVKKALIYAREEGASAAGLDKSGITVDSPIPYDLTTLRDAVESDKPPQASKQDSHNSILEKLEVLQSDGRLTFLMDNWSKEQGCDPFTFIVSQLLGDRPPPHIVDLSGIPNEVAGVVSAVIGRTLFNLKVWQTDEGAKEGPSSVGL